MFPLYVGQAAAPAWWTARSLAGRMLAAGPAAARPGPAGWPCSGPVIAHPGLADGPVLWRGMLARLPPVAAPRGLGDVRPCGADRSPTAMVGGDTVAHCGGAVRLRRPDRAARNRQHWARLICSSWNDLGLRLHGTLSFKTPGAALARLRLA